MHFDDFGKGGLTAEWYYWHYIFARRDQSSGRASGYWTLPDSYFDWFDHNCGKVWAQ